MNPLTPVTDYQSMLNRIFWFTSAAALGAVWMLREHLPPLKEALETIDITIAFGEGNILPIPAGYLLPAVAVGLASRIFRIHGHIASWLGIRERFDIDVIIHALADRVCFDLAGISDDELIDARHEIMRRAFYKFVGGSQPAIDVHLIYRALDLWSWFWIGIESAFVFVMTGFVLLATGNYQPGFVAIGAAVGFAAIGLPALRSECRRYAIAQVRAIVADPMRATAVREAFEDVFRRSQSLERAA